MSFLDLEKNGADLSETMAQGAASDVRIDSLNELMNSLHSGITMVNRGVKNIVGNKKKDSLDARKSVENSIQDLNEKINQYELTTGFRAMGKSFVNKVERDLSGLIMEFEALKNQYYKKKLMFPIYGSEEEKKSKSTKKQQGHEDVESSLLNKQEQQLSDPSSTNSYGTFANNGANSGKGVGSNDMYFSIPNSERTRDEQLQLQYDEENDQQQQQLQQLQQLPIQDQLDQQLLDEHEIAVGEQEQQMNVIHDQVTEVNLIFKQLGSLIQEQGAQVDTIENNVDSFNDNVQNASSKLDSAEKSQKARNRCGLMFLVMISIFLLILLIVLI